MVYILYANILKIEIKRNGEIDRCFQYGVA